MGEKLVFKHNIAPFAEHLLTGYPQGPYLNLTTKEAGTAPSLFLTAEENEEA